MMMKKFVVLMLVLGIVSAANATLSWRDASDVAISTLSLLPSGTATVYVYNDSFTGTAWGSSYAGPTTWNDDIAGITAATMQPAAGESAGVSVYGAGYGYIWFEAKDSNPDNNPTGNVAVGKWIMVTVTATGSNGESVNFTPDTYDAACTDMVVKIIPEPATIALLSLGGLLLRKRK
jgi:hypothetical protein